MTEKEIIEEFDVFDIDLTMLDKEWLTHPKIFFAFSIKGTKAARKVAEAKAELALAESFLADKMRRNPKKHKLGDKATEAAIKTKIPSKKMYKKYFNKLNDAIENHSILQDVVAALDHRRRGLERLVQLHGQNYFSEPRALDDRARLVADRIVKEAVRRAAGKKKKKKKRKRK